MPLTPHALDILDRQAIAKAKACLGYADSGPVYSVTGYSPPSGFSKAKRQLDLRMAALLGSSYDPETDTFAGGKFKPWRVHDLRRTAATGMETLGADIRVIELALNHVSGAKSGIAGVYQRAEYQKGEAGAESLGCAFAQDTFLRKTSSGE